MGVDYKVRNNLLVGVTAGYQYMNYRFRHGIGVGNIRSYQMGLYGSWQAYKNWYVDGLVSYGYNLFKGKRILNFARFTQQASQRHPGQQVGALFETGYDVKLDNKLFLTPLLSFGTLYQHEAHYREQEAGTLGLVVAPQRSTFYQSKAGAQLSKLIKQRDTELYGYIKLSYNHIQAFGKQKLTLNFKGNDEQFTVYGANKPANLVSPTVGLTTLFKNKVYLTADYSGNFGKKYRSHEAFIKIGKKF
ncbi:autotransporter outer membrane beta-barrel domain-containing protein [Candidatus Odyssella acanthamoebae]|uniref:Autotransporter domain-containing protein n=1 Tax=Candidatus Odyssella acanthamoebae TaxID=91604 RepID=A0A077AXT3_9PROT|nr:autotransporter outer membrane beta-barrel domain-containing protein [Candidatus Paracaedibacter acanthamoebae]AIK96819.1 hypothetical protein ID47_08875 [Candidatus Paracaedibacter acanthamoebae]